MKTFQSSDGLSIAYKDEGAGTPLLCLSGLTRNSSDFDYLAPHAQGARLIRMDYRGRGASDYDPDFTNYSLKREGQDALELLDHLGIEKAAVVGTSRGGLITMGLAAKHKNRLLGILLNDIGPVLEQEGLDVIMGHLGKPAPFKSYAEAELKMPARSEGFHNVPAERWAQEVRNRWIETENGLELRYDPKLRDAIAAASHGIAPEMWGFFDALEGIPAAVVRGENSNLLSIETVAEMKRRRPDLIHAEVKDRAHIPYLDEPECLDVFARFLKAVA